jgi:hypothetical protein
MNLTNDQARNPISDRTLLPLLTSVQILFRFLRLDLIGLDGPRVGAAESHASRRISGMIMLKTQFLIGTLLPLLTSVQILFCFFSSIQIGPDALKGQEPRKVRLAEESEE